MAGRRDDQTVEPATEAGALEQAAALAQGAGLGPVVDNPAAIDIIAEQIVITSTFEQDIDVALVVVAGVVAVLPAAPLVFIV